MKRRHERQPERSGVASRLALVALALLAVIMAEPRLHIALENIGDATPRRVALDGEILGQTLGLVISWSAGARQLIR